MKVSEENFITLLKNKNENGLDYVIENYGWIIKTIVQKQLYNLPNVQGECINDILLAIWSNIDQFDSNKGNFKNWVIGISKFKAIDFKRKYLKELSYENIDDLELSVPDNSLSEIIKNELDKDLEKLLSCLKENDRDLFMKLYVEEVDILNIVKKTGLKRENIYNRLSKGKKRMKSLQEELGFRR